jgi:DNA-binding SARP family transcriptional activator/tetratricopeptide (TPR) repeat protein
MTAEFRLLGNIEVRAGGRLIDAGHARRVSVLAVLLAEANHVVPADQLIDRVWGGQRLPVNPAGALQTYVSLLRRALAGEIAIVRQAIGYKAVADAESVDLHRFGSLLAQARAAGAESRAAALFSEALGLWRGEPFAGLDTPWINAARDALVMRRNAAQLDLTDIQLRRGQHAVLLPELAIRAASHSLDERVARQLMLALYRSGRQADALEHYERISRQLADELGADPGPPLRQLHQQMLTADPALDVPERSAALVSAGPAIPRQLPAPPRLFVGRARELDRLAANLDEQGESGGSPVISVISGTGGVGKTWLALHWAHRHLGRFPDGQLWADLRGFAPSGEPVPTELALRGFLDALGADPAVVPADPHAQAALYRSLVAGKRMLMVLDNARDSSQVIPLLPGTPGCAVLITSRRQLTGLITGHGARTLSLDLLPEADARDLLASYVGSGRLTAEPEAVAGLLACCAGLPLAISVIAAQAAAHPGFPLAVLAGELRDAATRLTVLETGDQAASVRTVLACSYQALDPQAAVVLGLLALAPGPDISLTAAASLAMLPAGQARAILRDLETASLVQEHGPGRYRIHDLVRLYAAERASRDQPDDDRAAALRRLADFYLHAAYDGDRLLAPARTPLSLDEPAAGCLRLSPSDMAGALAWFDEEHACLLAAQRLAADLGWHRSTWQLAWTLNTYHQRRGLARDQLATWRLALPSAQRLDDRPAQLLAHRWIGNACIKTGDGTGALAHLQRALALATASGDVTDQALGHHHLARAWEGQGDERRALTHAEHALRLMETVGNPVLKAQALNAVGWYHACLSNYAEARTACHAALELHREHGYLDGQGATLDSLGYIAHHTHHHTEAVSYYRQALAVMRERGNAYHEADILDHIAKVYLALHQYDRARDTWEQALALYQCQQRLADAQNVMRQLSSDIPGVVTGRVGP